MKEQQNIQRTMNKTAIVSPYQPLIALKVYRLNSPIKRYTVTEWGEKKKQIQLYAAYRRLTCLKEICHYSLYPFLETKGMEKDILCKC